MKDYQLLWDKKLLEGWAKEWKVGGVKASTFKEAKGLSPDADIDWDELDQFFDSISLKRYQPYTGQLPVRAFIEARSSNLSGCLWSGKYTDEELLGAIDNFKWKNISAASLGKYSSAKAARKKQSKQNEDREITIRARKLDKRNWNFVK